MKHSAQVIDNIELFKLILKKTEVASGLNDEYISKLFFYFAEIKKWNKNINLTGLKNDSDITERLLIDSLFLASVLNGNEEILDIGSGSGVPGIPVKIVYPESSCLLIDSSAKKVSFIKNVIRKLGLKKIDAILLRLDYKKGNLLNRLFDAVVFKAFAATEKSILEGLPYLKEKGRLILMKSGKEKELGTINGLTFLDKISYELPFSKISRKLLIWQKL